MRYQTLILQSDIGLAGELTDISFQLSNSTSGALFESVIVRIGHTTLDSLTLNFNDNFTSDKTLCVYNVDVNMSGSAGDWKNINLSYNTFDYNGTDNLIIDVKWTGCGSADAYTWAYDTPGYYQVVWGDNDSTGQYLYEYGGRIMIEYNPSAIQSTSLGSIKSLFE